MAASNRNQVESKHSQLIFFHFSANACSMETEVINDTFSRFLKSFWSQLSGTVYGIEISWFMAILGQNCYQAFFSGISRQPTQENSLKNLVRAKCPWVMGNFSWVMEKNLGFLENLLQKLDFWEAQASFFLSKIRVMEKISWVIAKNPWVTANFGLELSEKNPWVFRKHGKKACPSGPLPYLFFICETIKRELQNFHAPRR